MLFHIYYIDRGYFYPMYSVAPRQPSLKAETHFYKYLERYMFDRQEGREGRYTWEERGKGFPSVSITYCQTASYNQQISRGIDQRRWAKETRLAKSLDVGH